MRRTDSGRAPISAGRRPSRALALAGVVAALVLSAIAATALAHPFHPGARTAVTSSTAFGGLELEHLGAFDYPVQVTSPRGQRRNQFVVEQDGQVRVMRDGRLLRTPFLDLARSIDFNGLERGLLSIAFAPDYRTSRLFYVFYTDTGGDLRIEEFKRSASNPLVADRRTRRLVLRLEHSRYPTHNGGQLGFSPYDGNRLYISTGDGGGRYDPLGSGQNIDSRLGKILRIDPRASGSQSYTIPESNPFVGRAGRDEVWHYGLRNPWRFSFDRANGNMSIGDVGQDSREEIDFTVRRRRGANFGWRCFEGSQRNFPCEAPGHRLPVLEYTHQGGASCAVTGGFVVRDPAIERLAGRYVYGDYCTGALHAATLRETGATTDYVTGLIVPRLTGFGEDGRGRIYMTSRSYEDRPGAVYRLRAKPSP